MKRYESRLSQLPGHIIWTFCFYALCAIITGFLFYITGGTKFAWSTFCIIIAMWLGQSWRFRKMCYKINEDAFIQYDFQSRTIFIDQIVSVRVLKRMRWISFHTPYNMIIETIDKQKYFVAPQNRQQLADIFKQENPDIQVIQK